MLRTNEILATLRTLLAAALVAFLGCVAWLFNHAATAQPGHLAFAVSGTLLSIIATAAVVLLIVRRIARMET